MIQAETICQALLDAGIDFAAGVPDSLLSDFCSCISDRFSPESHVISANEGNAVGMAIGHYLVTGKPGLVYMQNSGLGNAVNPLTSLATREVYSIPMVLVIGWRGETDASGNQLKDEPQHVLQGKITEAMLETLGIQTCIIDSQTDIQEKVNSSVALAIREEQPVALLVRKNSFAHYEGAPRRHINEKLTRSKALGFVITSLDPSIPVISTTGKLSRELYELRRENGEIRQRDFLTVGGMGHASSIATGIAMHGKDKVACLDGDGAILMHMGAMTQSAKCANLIHIVFNNGAHESVGGQPTAAGDLSLVEIADKCGYGFISKAESEESIKEALFKANQADNSAFVEITCSNSSDPDLGRPKQSPIQNRDDFMAFISGKR